MIKGAQVKVGFEGSESVFYFPDGVVYVPYHYFVLHIEISAQKIDTQVQNTLPRNLELRFVRKVNMRLI